MKIKIVTIGVYGFDESGFFDALCQAEKEVDAIWTQVKQDEEKEDKYYTLEPDTARQSGEFAEDSLVHNCVTWIIETQHVSVNRFLLKRVRNGNISQFAENLHQTGDSL